VPDCIYCQKPNTEPSAEHVVAEALGGCLTLQADAVCKTCNNKVLGDEIDVPVMNDLRPLLVAHGIEGKSGRAPSMTVVEPDADEGSRRYVVGKDYVGAAEPRKVLSHEDGEYAFRAASLAELEKARTEIARKNPGKKVVLTAVEERVPTLPPDRVDEVDFTAPHWSRWAAKTCLNLVAHVWGTDAARSSEFDALRDHVMDSTAAKPTGLTVGGCGCATVDADEAASEHRIELRCSDGRVVMKMRTFDFCGFKYQGDAQSLSSLTRRIVLDAVNAKMASDETD